MLRRDRPAPGLATAADRPAAGGRPASELPAPGPALTGAAQSRAMYAAKPAVCQVSPVSVIA